MFCGIDVDFDQLHNQLADPVVQGAVAALVSTRLHLLDAVQGDQLCHMRSVISVICCNQFRDYLKECEVLNDAEELVSRWYRISSEKAEDEAFFDKYNKLVKTCYKVLGGRRMEIIVLCFDTTLDVTWVFTPMSISTYFRDQGRVENKAEKQSRIQTLCIDEFEAVIASMRKSHQAGSFLDQTEKALKLMRNRITEGGKDIPVLNFFVATLVMHIIDFMTGKTSAMAVRRMSIGSNGTLSLAKIEILYFHHNRDNGQYEETQLSEDQKRTAVTFYQTWSKYKPGQEGDGVHSMDHGDYREAVSKRMNELLVRYLANHPTYADSVAFERNETQTLLEEVCGHNALSGQETDITQFSFNPFGENASLIDVWEQARRIEENIGAGIHKPLETIVRGKIYKETTARTAWNIDHIFGATPIQIETWAKHTMNAHEQAGFPELGCYLVVAGSVTLPCETEVEAYAATHTKEKKRKNDFLQAHPVLSSVIGLSWQAAFQ